MGKALVAATAVAVGGMTAAILATSGPQDEGLAVALRWTARTSLALFVAAFVASSVNRLWRGSAIGRWLLRNRRALGLSFAVSHIIHLGLIVTRMASPTDAFWQERTVGSMVPGMIAYAFVALLAATSFDGAVKWLGRRRWKALHKVGIYVIAAVFVGAFATPTQRDPIYVAPLGVLVLAFGLRAAARIAIVRQRRARV